MTKRANILSNIETVLGNISGIGTVEVGKLKEFTLSEVTLPALFAYAGTDEPTEGPTEYESYWLNLSVEAWCKDSDVESLLGSVHTAVMADITRGGYALNTLRDVVTPLLIDLPRSIGGFEILFKILYRHPAGLP